MEFVGRELDWSFDPLEALRRWPADRQVMLLHSGRADPRWARWSILAEPVGMYRFRAINDHLGLSEWTGRADALPSERFTHRPFRDMQALLDATDALWLGQLSYDLGRWIEKLPTHAADDRHWPVIELGCCPGQLVYDNTSGRWRACGDWAHGGYPPLDVLESQTAAFTATNLRCDFTRDSYERAIRRTLEYIAAGDIFQANIAQRFTADLAGPYPLAHRAAYCALAAVSPAWYGAYLELAGRDELPDARRVIASTSPELFIEVDAQGRVVTRPIKGTRPATVPADELRDSEKDAAELNMIVDLLRNDLGRVCTYGSVRVPQPRVIESHPTVHHGVATITGRLHERKTVIDLLRATMPGGSITGAPKVRAMQIIDELEPVRRGPYCGAIGCLSRSQSCLNIAIRTMLLDERRVDFSVGGGIVADSTPQAEYQETLDKAAAIMTALRLRPSQAVAGAPPMPLHTRP